MRKKWKILLLIGYILLSLFSILFILASPLHNFYSLIPIGITPVIIVGFLLIESSINLIRRNRNQYDGNSDTNNSRQSDDIHSERLANYNTSIIQQFDISQLKPIKMTKEDSICMICKLEIMGEELVYQCSKCNNYYHKKHLEDWLKGSTKCPLCKMKFKSN